MKVNINPLGRQIMKKSFASAIIFLGLGLSCNASADIGVISGITWADTPAAVQAKSTDFKELRDVTNSKTFEGVLKQKQAILGEGKKITYHFTGQKMFSASVTVEKYTENSTEAINKAKADYQAMKTKIAKTLGVKPNEVESFNKDKPFFQCIYDENCGTYASSFVTKDTEIALFLMGSESGSRSELMVTVRRAPK